MWESWELLAITFWLKQFGRGYLATQAPMAEASLRMAALALCREPTAWSELIARSSKPDLQHRHWLFSTNRHRRQPVALIRGFARQNGIERIRDLLGERTDGALADADLVHRTNGRD